MDEFNASIHPINPIFLNSNLFRRDEIKFVDDFTPIFEDILASESEV